MHVIEDFVVFPTPQNEKTKGNARGKTRARRTMARNGFIGMIFLIFFSSCYFLHGTVAHLDAENTKLDKDANKLQVPGGMGASLKEVLNVKKDKTSSESVMVEFTVSHLNGDPDSSGTFVVQTMPEWSKLGAERFVDLVNDNFFDNCRFFRVLKDFIAQWGMSGDKAKDAKWHKSIKDEKVKQTNSRGTVTFAMAGPGTRGHQFFINKKNNKFLDSQGFAPFGKVVEGMDVVEKLYAGYGEGAPHGNGPSQNKIRSQGNAYLKKSFPKLSYIASAKVKTE